MTRARTLTPRGSVVLALLLAATLLALLPAGPTRAATDAAASPLTVRLVRLTPAAIPAKGKVVLAGTVRNDSDETWSSINAYPFLGAAPITTREELAAAVATDPTADVGPRITTPGLFVSIGDLAPGASAPFTIKLPASALPRQPGVYWIGVHALGQNADGRDQIADGRARTFIPLVAPHADTAVSLVVPVRERVRRDRVGRLADTFGWSQTLSDDGRLERIAALLNSAEGRPATMLVDPAVIDAVASITADNPALSLGEGPAPGASDSPSATPTDTPGDLASPSRDDDRLGPDDRSNAARWLAQVKSASSFQTVLGLGYADPDTASLARHRPAYLALAAKQSATAFERLGIDAVPTVAPPTGWLDDQALTSIDQDSLVLVSDQAAPRTRTHWRTPEGQDLVFADAQAASGGPGPTAPLDALAVRQRILADAALRAQAGLSTPMVVELPDDWDPGPQWQDAQFFAGLDQPWLHLESVDRSPATTTPRFDAALGYTASERHDEIGLANISAARGLIGTANLMGRLLRSTNDVRYALTGMALAGVSYHARRDEAHAREGVVDTNAAMRSRLAKVSVVGTDFVTLSGGSGILTVTLVNQLDQPIRVGVEAHTTSSAVHIDRQKPLDLAPGQRTVLRLHARASAIGVQEVTLTPVTADGAELGTPLTFNLRTSQVGKMIWIVLIGGGALLVVMILRRVVRGIREHRWRGQ